MTLITDISDIMILSGSLVFIEQPQQLTNRLPMPKLQGLGG